MPVSPSTGTADVMKTRFSQTTGDESPAPGTATFHFTFFVSLHSVGGVAVADAPFPVGPRQCGQFSADEAELHRQNISASIAKIRGIQEFIQSVLEVSGVGALPHHTFVEYPRRGLNNTFALQLIFRQCRLDVRKRRANWFDMATIRT